MNKLVFDARMIKHSGIGTYLQALIPLLLNRSFNATFIGDISTLNSLLDETSIINCDYKIYSVKELLFLPFKVPTTDIFWSPHYNVPLFNFSTKYKVVTIHDVYHLAYFNALSIKQKLYAKLMISRAIKSDVIFTVSQFSKSEIIKYTRCDKSKIQVVYNGVDFDRFNIKVSENERKTGLAKYGLQKQYVLYVGNVKPHKNLKNALLAFKQYLQTRSGSKIEFVIVGKREGFLTGDDEVQKLLVNSTLQKYVRFTGWVVDEDLPLLYQNAALFIFPSFYEGFGFPPLEAMAAGCPVISSNAACMPEIYGDAVYYFDPANVAHISDAFKKVLFDKEFQENLRQKGFHQAKKYTWEKAVEAKLKVINSLQ